MHAETQGSACAKDAAHSRAGVAEGVQESLDLTAESHPGRGDVPRGNGAGLANTSGKNAEMRLSVSVSICALAGAVPDAATRTGLLRPPEDACPRLGRGFAGGAQGSCLRMARHRARGDTRTCWGCSLQGAFQGAPGLGGIPGLCLGHPGKSSQTWSSLINVIFPRNPGVCQV